jgi:release factor glutamine methyltransferase
VTRALASAGCIAPRAEAAELLAAGDRDGVAPETLVARRVRGEPLAWITGSTTFCDLRIRVDPGVYVPRPQSEALARRAASLLPATGVAVDLCTGSGAIAAVLRASRPDATIVAVDLDPVAVTCARRNDVMAFEGDLDDALPGELRGLVDVVVAVPPYVPTRELALLPRDVVAFEPVRALDGGQAGTDLSFRIVGRSVRWLRPGGALLLELGGDQAARVGDAMNAAGFDGIRIERDADGDVRSIEACLTRFPSAG